MNELAAFLRRPDIAAEMEDDLRTLVAVPSVGAPGEGGYPFGSACAAVLDAALALGEKYGFATENHAYYCGSILYGDAEKELGIVTHLDVVPASKEGWTGDPFTLLRDGDLLIGRGTEDDQGAVHRLALHAAFPEGDAPRAALRRAADSGLRRGERLHRPCALPLGAQRALLRLHARFGVPGLYR